MGINVIDDPRGNQALGVKARKENQERQADIMIKAITGGFDEYKTLLEGLKKEKGKSLTENQKLYMDKIEKMAEFAIPKRAREDGKGNADVGDTIVIADGKRLEAKDALNEYLEK